MQRAGEKAGAGVNPIALDLCCGKGGWSRGLMDTGWDVIGVDIEDMGGYPSKLVLADIIEVAKNPEAFFPGLKVDLVVASPPCQEFSYRSFPFKRARFMRDNVPPKTDIWEACQKIAEHFGAPLVLENVRGAVRYMGPAQAHFGPFYLWGDVPVLLPDGRPQKGFGKSDANADRWESKKRFADEYERVNGLEYQSRGKCGPLNAQRAGRGPEMSKARDGYKRIEGSGKHSGNSRKEWSAIAAMIPYELSHWIGETMKPENK